MWGYLEPRVPCCSSGLSSVLLLPTALHSLFLLHLFCFCMLATGIGRVSFGAFLGRCATCKFIPLCISALIIYLCPGGVLRCHHVASFLSWMHDSFCCFVLYLVVMSFIPLLNHFSAFAIGFSTSRPASKILQSRFISPVFLPFALPDLSFITTWPFLWKVSAITLISCLPLYIIKYLKRKFSPPSYSKLSSWSKPGLLEFAL